MMIRECRLLIKLQHIRKEQVHSKYAIGKNRKISIVCGDMIIDMINNKKTKFCSNLIQR